MFQVNVVSKEIIKPASPTPDHLRNYSFSFLDQTRVPHVYSYLILFFESNGEKQQPNITEISKILKQSLADVLTLYYPLAGRSHDNHYIDCNDYGIPFLEAQVTNHKLFEVLWNSIPTEDLTKLVPFQLDDAHNNIPFGVQLNVFACGGFAIGQCISHKIADGVSMLMFSRAWAATARRELRDDRAEIQPPEFVAATLFPPKLLAQTKDAPLAKEKLATRRFVFDASNMDRLKAKYGHDLERRPSRFEALSAFIWSRLMAVTKEDATHDHQKLHFVFHAVNMRPRFDSPLPLYSFGNLVSTAISIPSLSNTSEECYGLARLMREETRKIDSGYIRKLQECNDRLHDHDHEKSGVGKVLSFFSSSLFSSFCNVSSYDNDFGWGRPTWATLGSPNYNINYSIIFTDARDASGIEASITSTEDVLTRLEHDNEFLERICPRFINSGHCFSHKPTTTASMNTRNRARM